VPCSRRYVVRLVVGSHVAEPPLRLQVQASISDASKFGQLLKLKGFMPFNSAANALENANHVSEGLLPDDLKTFLEQNLPRVKPGKKAKFFVGVVDPKIGNAIQDELNVPCNSNETVLELIRGVRQHLPKFIKQLVRCTAVLL